MKQLLLILAACSAKKQEAPPVAAAPTPAVVVEQPKLPAGLPVVAKIGAAGGSVQSNDGLLAIAIPAGALAAETAISVQEIPVDVAGSPTGRGYRLEPSGTAFAKPIELAFSPEPGRTLDGAAVATRDATGWLAPAQRHDGNVIRVPAAHFSDWAISSGIALIPGDTSVGVNGAVSLTVQVCYATNPSGDLRVSCQDPHGTSGYLHASKLTVNGIAGGNAEVGTIELSGDNQLVYRSPAAPPAQNPVAVGVEFTTLPNERYGRTMGFSNIFVADKPSYIGVFTMVQKHAEGETRGHGYAMWNYDASDRAWHARGYQHTDSVLGCPVSSGGAGPLAKSVLTIENGKLTARIWGLEVTEAPCQDTAVEGKLADSGGLDLQGVPAGDDTLTGTFTSSDPDFPTTYTWKFWRMR